MHSVKVVRSYNQLQQWDIAYQTVDGKCLDVYVEYTLHDRRKVRWRLAKTVAASPSRLEVLQEKTEKWGKKQSTQHVNLSEYLRRNPPRETMSITTQSS